jgi:predicted phosphodiesterase
MKTTMAKTTLEIRKDDAELRSKVVSYLKNHRSTLEDLSEKFQMKPGEVREYMNMLHKEDVNVTSMRSRGGTTLYHVSQLPAVCNVFNIEPDKVGVLSFGFASDLHSSSKFYLQNSFHNVMDKLEGRGVSRVYIAGDILEGTHVYNGQETLLQRHSVEDQTDFAADEFAKHPRLNFSGISGNHEIISAKHEKTNALAILQEKADNFKYLGDMIAKVVCDCVQFIMIHGNRAYASLYPSHAILKDYFYGLTKKEMARNAPDLMLLGHFHTLYQGIDRGVLVLQPGSFLVNSNERRDERLHTTAVGAWHVEIEYSNPTTRNPQINRVQTTYIRPDPAATAKDMQISFAESAIGSGNLPAVN